MESMQHEAGSEPVLPSGVVESRPDIADLPARVTQSQQACPATGTGQSGVLSDVETFYGSTTLGAVSGAGDATQVDTATSGSGSGEHFAKVTYGFDGLGRQTRTTQFTSGSDTTGRTTTNTYTPASGGPLTQTTVKDPLGHTVTDTVDPGRGVVTHEVDVAGHVTDAAYDALGRLQDLWRPGQVKGTTRATATYGYKVSQTAPSAVRETDLVDPGTGSVSTASSYTLYDSYGEVLQTQAPGDGGGAVVSDSTYDSAGRVVEANHDYFVTNSPSTTLLAPTESGVANRTTTTFDGAGRATKVSLYDGDTFTSSTSSVYGGDRTTVIPPTGGVETTNVTDARGETVESDRWSSPPTISGTVLSGGVADRTTYSFDALGHRTLMVTAAGTSKAASFGTSYDLAGRVVAQDDPDSGHSTASFDDAGDEISSTDAKGQVVASTYDAGGRLTGQYAGSTTGTRLTGFVYDTLQAGALTSSTRYVGGKAYTTATTGFDSAGRPTGARVSLSVAGFASSYTSAQAWTSTGLLESATVPAAGNQAAETVTYGYDSLGQPVSATGASTYVAASVLDRDMLVAERTLGSGTSTTYLNYGLDAQTRRVDSQILRSDATNELDATSYHYDLAGNVVRTSDREGMPGAPQQDTCYSYDRLDRLVQAWTATDLCAADPAVSGPGTVGGPQPFWESWSFDAAGDRATQTAHGLPAGVSPLSGSNPLTPTTGSNVTSYSYGSTGHAHDLTGLSRPASLGQLIPKIWFLWVD